MSKEMLPTLTVCFNAVIILCFFFHQDISKGSKTVAGKVFLLTWKFFTSKVVRDFTLMSAPSFGEYNWQKMGGEGGERKGEWLHCYSYAIALVTQISIILVSLD